MPGRIAAAVAMAGHPPLPTQPAVVRCILDSLAAAYAATTETVATLTGHDVGVVHIVGGGSRNGLLCQLTADALGKPVLAGPAEATALGNVLVQARAGGALPQDLAALRRRFGLPRGPCAVPSPDDPTKEPSSVSSKPAPIAPVNIKAVATQAGVSVGTVSNVLNRPSAVRPATRARVEAAIIELGFVPNASARQLVVGQNHTIAYVVLDASNPFFTDVARGIEDVAETKNLSLFICNSDQSEEREDRFLERLTELRVRGVLITALEYENPRLAQLRQLGVPVVLVDRAPTLADDWCAVGVDDLAGGDMAIAHLLDTGRDKLVFVGGPTNVPQLSDRLTGARNAVARAGLGEESFSVLDTSSPTIAQGRRAGERLLGLSKRSRPNGVFCANDLLAFGLVQVLLQHGVRVPEDIAVVGYDDIELADAASVPLTSVSQPRHALGRSRRRVAPRRGH